ncbi:hypothetical protein PROFUN_11900 [Planoprotostelium fungivorum]|uniref:Uncharacterized protein n=1 Tax=Planoprotostelium fungivorum TaxID=1890364 RepID=A0A2P6N925_9EUKA|nr:hypothetical protein PROFUN_11900 [Planoprotostelium fungivorum]
MPYTANHPNRAALLNLVQQHRQNGYNSAFRGKASTRILSDTTVEDDEIDSWYADAQAANAQPPPNNVDELWVDLRDAIVPPVQTAPAGSSSHSGGSGVVLTVSHPTLISVLTELKTTTIDTNTALKAYLSDKKTVAMSKVKEDQFSEALQAAGIKRVQTKIVAPQVKSSTPYKWDERDEDDQTADVIKWLRGLIPEGPLGLKYHDISTKRSENAKVRIADLTLSGRGDIKISTDDTVGYDSVVVATLSGTALCQGMSEMMAAASISCHPVVGILTDTQKWAFYWMRTKREIGRYDVYNVKDGVGCLKMILERLPNQIPQQLGSDPKPLPEYFDHPRRTLIQGSDFCYSSNESNTLDLIPFLEPCDQLDVYANHYYQELSYFI